MPTRLWTGYGYGIGEKYGAWRSFAYEVVAGASNANCCSRSAGLFGIAAARESRRDVSFHLVTFEAQVDCLTKFSLRDHSPTKLSLFPL